MTAAVAFEPTQEIRLALVMYGGVSLAIYMNGISQELLHLVRATAPDRPMSEKPSLTRAKLEGSEVVYRKLGQILAHGCPPETTEPAPTAAVRTRFVIDIISGSSAGGINGVFLAKALANDQSIGSLKDLWVNEGAMDRLLNDRTSMKDIGLKPDKPPDSLLSGPRMYYQLLRALDGLDQESAAVKSPFVEELDLWVTTTDLRGLTLPLKVANNVVYERRHRSMFRFVHRTEAATGEDKSEFSAAVNPLLAFAARCTSSFPFAFPPMMLTDTDKVLTATPGHSAPQGSGNPAWKTFFPKYVRVNDEYSVRSFGDGGDLDNKPFSWAVNTLTFRQATLPVHRMLAFVEPDPGHPERESTPTTRPDPVSSVMAAALLARQEAIRDDLLRVREYNRAADQMLDAMEAVERGFAAGAPGPANTEAWLAETPRAAGQQGGAVQVYEHLKVAQAVDELTLLIAAMVNVDDESDHRTAIQLLVQAQIESRYRAAWENDDKPSLRMFLRGFDYRYRIRRLNFLFRRADTLALLDGRCEKLLEKAGQPPIGDDDRDAFLKAVVAIKGELGDAFVVLRKGWRGIGQDTTLKETIAGLEIGPDHLDAILVAALVGSSPHSGPPLPAACYRSDLTPLERARALVADPTVAEALKAFAEGVATHTSRIFPEASAIIETVLPEGPGDGTPRGIAQAALRFYYDRFVEYDEVTLPLLIGRMGEGAHVEVLRFSPEDARSLSSLGAAKLAGSSIGHFGAFFDRAWRRWDITWGRLDGAELLINSVLPQDHPLRADLLRQAQIAILTEELTAPPEVVAAIAAELLGTADGVPPNRAVLDSLPQDTDTSLARRTVDAALDPEEFLQRLTKVSGPPPGPEPGYTLSTASRAARIVGDVLQGMSKQSSVGVMGRLLSRLGQVGWGLVELAMPSRNRWRLVRTWVSMLLVVELFLVVGGIAVHQPGATRLGWWSLGLTLGLVLVRGLLAEFLRLKKVGRKATVVIAVVLVLILGLAGYGGWTLVDDARDHVCSSKSERVRDGTPFACPPRASP